MKTRHFTLAILPILAIQPFAASAIAAESTVEASLPTPVANAAASADGRFVYAFGGQELIGRNVSFRDEILRFDPAAGVVDPVGVLPTPRMGVGATWTGREFILVGGSGDGGPLTDILHWNPTTGTLLEGPDLPFGVSNPAVVWNGTHVLVFGGLQTCGPGCTLTSGKVHTYEPLTRTLQARDAAMPVPTASAAAFVHNGSVYLFGGLVAGLQERSFSDAVMRYDPALDAFETLEARMPLHLAGAGAAPHGESVILLGGEFLPGRLNERPLRFHPATGTFEAATAGLEHPRSAAGVAVLNATAFLMGGIDCTKPVRCDTVVAVPLSSIVWGPPDSIEGPEPTYGMEVSAPVPGLVALACALGAAARRPKD